MVEPNTNSMRGRSKPTKSFGELHGSEVYRQTYSAAWPSSMPSGNVLSCASSSPSTLSNNIAGATMAVINMMRYLAPHWVPGGLKSDTFKLKSLLQGNTLKVPHICLQVSHIRL